jgi:CrcB protein
MMYFWVALGSAIGGAARYWCSGVMARLVGETFPWGTMTVNAVGSFLIMVFFIATEPDGRLLASPALRQFVMVGLMGGYTTFSSFSLQTLQLARDGEWLLAALNVLGSVVICLAAAWCGYVVGAMINR